MAILQHPWPIVPLLTLLILLTHSQSVCIRLLCCPRASPADPICGAISTQGEGKLACDTRPSAPPLTLHPDFSPINLLPPRRAWAHSGVTLEAAASLFSKGGRTSMGRRVRTLVARAKVTLVVRERSSARFSQALCGAVLWSILY